MAYITTYKNIQDRVLELLGKSDATTRNRVKNWINMGQDDFVTRELWPFREKTGSLSTVQGTQEYSLASNFSDIDNENIISVALQGTVASKLPYVPYNQLRADKPDFDADSGLPIKYYLKGRTAGAYNIGFWPVPDAVYSVDIDYFKLPTELSADADESIIPLSYREALLHYALSMEHDFNTDPDLAQKAMNRYEQKLTLARQNLLTQPNDTGNFVVMGPADNRSWTGLADEVT